MLKNVGYGLIWLASYLPALLRDMVGLSAVALIAYGAWLILPAAGFIVAGVLLLAGVICLSVRAR